MMKLFIGIALFPVSSCVYDPPRKGVEIIIENQTPDKFLVLDSLPDREVSILIYDTCLVNNRNYVFRRNIMAHEFGKATYFLWDQSIEKEDRLNQRGIKSLFLIADSNASKSYAAIIEKGLYKKINIPLDEVRRYSTNYLFIYPDSIYFTKQFDMLTPTK